MKAAEVVVFIVLAILFAPSLIALLALGLALAGRYFGRDE